MKINKTLFFIFGVMLVLYIIAQLYQPKKFDWTATLRNDDKNPFGTYIIFKELKSIFPQAQITSHRIPLYNVLHNSNEKQSAYILFEPEFKPGEADLKNLLKYVKNGNIVFLTSFYIDKAILDTLGLKVQLFTNVIYNDSTSINFVNPALKTAVNYHFKRSTINGYFDSVNKINSTVILGINKDSMPDFVKVRYGQGYFLVHAAPLCFSNYFMLYHHNSDYTAKALSYIPKNIQTVHWDEYYKAGREQPATPLRFFFSNTYLSAALWITVFTALLYLFFEIKRRQRSIPVIEPMRNTTLDFVETVSSVYYSQHDNNSIAHKKIQLWYDFVRQHYYLPTQNTDEAFQQKLQKKSGVPEALIKQIIKNNHRAEAQPVVTDDLLIELSNNIDEFYRLSKS